ncbi:hypothetical protein J7E38_02075 [Bacillus sp. ISL-35]|uniref:hypothetical protein n=1 Tax=Bacillus sp. ISL-35 TaxID=2819122 RepID=UPI001BE4EB5F|nr:hypothetical protein [Bacillus sp. ISL-35]MBT2677768.1 hypothetical protein [Bacillus sp. ISL-35]MBT2704519.1 hypothetical protein [Chryseobacterium sp. ISL-80]
MFQQSSGSETNIKLPISYIFFSMIALITSQLLILLNGDMLITGTFRLPAIWSAAHLFVLGWALMVAMGAMYQLVPVAFLTPIWSEKFGFWQFAVTALGILTFATALYLRPQDALVPGIMTLTGILMFLVQMYMTLRSQAKPNILTLFVGSALFSLLLTIALGITLVISMKTGFASEYYQAMFKTHILLGTVGWFSLLIFGFSYKMVPMFSLAHGFTMKPAAYVFTVYFAGIILMVAYFFTGSHLMEILGTFMLLAGFLVFTWHVKKIIDKRVKRKLDRPFMFALFAVGCGAAIHLAAFVSSSVNLLPKTAGPILLLYLMAWIAFSIIGYLYKIVPFLWWTHKYSKEIGKKQVPALKDMMDEKLALPLFILFTGGTVLLIISFFVQLMPIFYIAQSLILMAGILFSYIIAKVLTI